LRALARKKLCGQFHRHVRCSHFRQGFPMKYSFLLAATLATLGLVACDKTVVAPPAAAPVVIVPGPAGPAGAAGETGATGNTGDTGADGKKGDTLIVIPAK
jgi:hypothetical protein